ncbi:hypothetical protein EYR40_004796 [Pleurotus pulmonarius]|nr:hypothetical protein EYR36_006825 [Pleurotus pulmonarius]KAF4601518.1 hypothetical protein EYR38_006172 [Pleurotus pulmonarius]KAF4601598.1 hypothetical protein EYR40_004796 [Pleurotus pulmonarius]
MKAKKSAKGRAILLKWATPAQFHFITDRYHDFNNTASDRDKRTKFWKSLMKDWSSEWELNPKVEQKLRNYYNNMRGRTLRRLLSASLSTAHRALPRHSTSRMRSSITTISPKSDEEIDELEPSTGPESPGADQATSPQRSHFQQSSIRARMIPRSDKSVAESLEEDNVMIDVPGFKPSDIQTIYIGGDLLVRGERNDPRKGKNKENEVQRSPQLSNYMEAKIELPMGLQAEEVQVTFDAGRLTVHFPGSSTLCMPVAVDEIYEDSTSSA